MRLQGYSIYELCLEQSLDLLFLSNGKSLGFPINNNRYEPRR